MIDSVHIQYFKGLENVEIADCGRVNALIGKNNSGKSSVLHAIDLAGLALSRGDWSTFPLKLQMEDLFWPQQQFSVALDIEGVRALVSSGEADLAPRITPDSGAHRKIRSVFIAPDAGNSLLTREHRSPAQVFYWMENRDYRHMNALDMLYAVRFYASRGERGFSPGQYEHLVESIREFFPELSEIESGRTENDVGTILYVENGKTLDILYSGNGLKYSIDLLVKVEMSRANIVLIDEPESGLHPSLQRKFAKYMVEMAEIRDLQIFLATHSQVFLNFVDTGMRFYQVSNRGGTRTVVPIPRELRHTLFGDLGVRPSDLFHSDICVMVEGASDVIFIDYLVNTLYSDKFEGVSVAVIQYGGSSGVDGFIKDTLRVENLVASHPYTYWIHDRDAPPGEAPDPKASAFIDKLNRAGFRGKVLDKREIEYYYPESVLRPAQGGDPAREQRIVEIVHGNQLDKLSKLAGDDGCRVPKGSVLRRLLADHMTKDDVDPELKRIIEDELLAWAAEICGSQ